MSRVLGAGVVVGGLTALYLLWRRNLVAAIVVHVVADAFAAATAVWLLTT